MIIAVTLSDEVNMVACQVAHSVFNVPTKIARIRAQSYLKAEYQDLFLRENLPIDVIISPEIEVGEVVLRRIALQGATDVLRFADDKIIGLAIECLDECPVINTPLRQLTELFPDLTATVVGVVRNDSLFIPRSSDELNAGDLAYVVRHGNRCAARWACSGMESRKQIASSSRAAAISGFTWQKPLKSVNGTPA